MSILHLSDEWQNAVHKLGLVEGQIYVSALYGQADTAILAALNVGGDPPASDEYARVLSNSLDQEPTCPTRYIRLAPGDGRLFRIQNLQLITYRHSPGLGWWLRTTGGESRIVMTETDCLKFPNWTTATLLSDLLEGQSAGLAEAVQVATLPGRSVELVDRGAVQSDPGPAVRDVQPAKLSPYWERKFRPLMK
ncbi:MAG: hypothetical protein F4206_15025 [Gammaproteobacteria bacterium]|nr:hypothetical protein [Gammaproteobacteria bacterium]